MAPRVFLLCQYTALWYKRIYPYQLAAKLKPNRRVSTDKIHPDLRRLDIRYQDRKPHQRQRGQCTKRNTTRPPPCACWAELVKPRHGPTKFIKLMPHTHATAQAKNHKAQPAHQRAWCQAQNALRARRKKQLTGRVGRRVVTSASAVIHAHHSTSKEPQSTARASTRVAPSKTHCARAAKSNSPGG